VVARTYNTQARGAEQLSPACLLIDLRPAHAPSGPHPQPWPNTPTELSTTWTFIHIWRVVGGVIVEHWACCHDMGLLEQLRQ